MDLVEHEFVEEVKQVATKTEGDDKEEPSAKKKKMEVEATNNRPKEQVFFAKEASKQAKKWAKNKLWKKN